MPTIPLLWCLTSTTMEDKGTVYIQKEKPRTQCLLDKCPLIKNWQGAHPASCFFYAYKPYAPQGMNNKAPAGAPRGRRLNNRSPPSGGDCKPPVPHTFYFEQQLPVFPMSPHHPPANACVGNSDTAITKESNRARNLFNLCFIRFFIFFLK